MLLDDGLHELHHLLPLPPHAARNSADEHGQPRRREEVRQARAGEQLDPSLHQPEERLPVLEPAASDDGAHRRVGDARRYHPAQVDDTRRRRRPFRRRRRHGEEEAPDLLLADGSEGQHAAGAEELEGADLPELPPPVAVGREDDALASLRQGQPRRPGDGARREGEVVRLRDLARRVRRRGHHDGELAEAEQHERAVARGEVTQLVVVRELSGEEVVEVADHRERPRPRRRPPCAGKTPVACRTDEVGHGKDDQGSEEEQVD
ncbi:Os06g0641932, partial [Oryza sativa Japonica Group]